MYYEISGATLVQALAKIQQKEEKLLRKRFRKLCRYQRRQMTWLRVVRKFNKILKGRIIV